MPRPDSGKVDAKSALQRAAAAGLGGSPGDLNASVRRPPAAWLMLPTPSAAPPDAGPAQPGATPRNTAQQSARPYCKTNPLRPPTSARPVPAQAAPARPAGAVASVPRGPLRPVQMTAARLLLAGRPVKAVAAALGMHPYTVSRWKSDPRFQAELRRQVDGATGRNTAQQNRRQKCKTNPPKTPDAFAVSYDG